LATKSKIFEKCSPIIVIIITSLRVRIRILVVNLCRNIMSINAAILSYVFKLLDTPFCSVPVCIPFVAGLVDDEVG